jgi:hypothetical protein
MLDKPGWEQSLRRWQAFWAGELADRPPIQVAIVSGEALDTGEPPSLESTLARFDPLRNEPILEAAERALNRHAAIPDDNPPAMQAGGGVYFTGAVFGAPVRATADVMTAEPILDDWDQLDDLRLDLDNAWVRRALGLARQLVARSGGRYAVTPGLIEGPSDICAALRGITRLAGDLYEFPEEVRRLAEMGAVAWEVYAPRFPPILCPAGCQAGGHRGYGLDPRACRGHPPCGAIGRDRGAGRHPDRPRRRSQPAFRAHDPRDAARPGGGQGADPAQVQPGRVGGDLAPALAQRPGHRYLSSFGGGGLSLAGDRLVADRKHEEVR